MQAARCRSVEIGAILGKAVVFLFGAMVIGSYLSPRVFGIASQLHGRGILLDDSAGVLFHARLWRASSIGLAPIVGAYAAG